MTAELKSLETDIGETIAAHKYNLSMPASRYVLGISAITVVLIAVFVTRYEVGVFAKLAPADRIIVFKSDHTMSLYHQNTLLKTYNVALGRGGSGPKERRGDNRVPEGIYRIDAKNPGSEFHRSLHISYPTPTQIAADRKRGLSAGDDIMVHGIKNGLGWLGPMHRMVDWTRAASLWTTRKSSRYSRLCP